MADLQITNITPDEDIYLADLYTGIPAGKTKHVQRSATDLPRMWSLQQAMAAGKLTLSVTYSADEVQSGLHAPTATVEAVDLAPVAPAAPAAALATIYKKFEAGVGGVPDDVEIFPVGSLPFGFRVLDLVAYVSSSPGASQVALYDEPGGSGVRLASADTSTPGRKVNAENATNRTQPAASKGLFLRRSNNTLAGEVVLVVRPEL